MVFVLYSVPTILIYMANTNLAVVPARLKCTAFQKSHLYPLSLPPCLYLSTAEFLQEPAPIGLGLHFLDLHKLVLHISPEFDLLHYPYSSRLRSRDSVRRKRLPHNLQNPR